MSAAWVQPAAAQFGINQFSRTPFQFALIGDVPYDDEQIAKFDNLIADVNSNRQLLWVLHAGDIKAGDIFCDDATLQDRFDRYQRFNKPFIYTPGDNEWTDCHRDNNGNFNPLERLRKIRQLFYPRPGRSTGGVTMRVLSQSEDPDFSEFVENQLWVHGTVVFAAIHIVGSNNNLSTWSGIDPNDSAENPRPDRLAEFERRQAASLAWLEEAFDTAAQFDSPGVFVMIHGDPRIDEGTTDREGFLAFVNLLRERTASFDGEVVLTHGDTHFFRIDKLLEAPVGNDPDRSTKLENFTRVETFGTEDVHWLLVSVNPLGPRNVFSFQPMIIDANRFSR